MPVSPGAASAQDTPGHTRHARARQPRITSVYLQGTAERSGIRRLRHPFRLPLSNVGSHAGAVSGEYP